MGIKPSCIGIRNQEAVDLVGHGVSNVVDAVDYVPRKKWGWDEGPRHDHCKWGYKLWGPYNMPKMNV